MILIVDNHSKNVPLIKAALTRLNASYIVRGQKALFRDVERKRIKGVIMSGGRPVLDKEIHLKDIRADISCLINYDVPILGICEGHEIIGVACGGELRALRIPARSTDNKVRLLTKRGIFRGLPSTIPVYEHHSKYLRDVPATLQVAATSTKDRIEAVFHKHKPIFGLQFHPERMGDTGLKIFFNFLALCKKK
ncbi:MAG: gamma-glutamyl-gamma-aminobutyrate hydrolase family protein [archaeon]